MNQLEMIETLKTRRFLICTPCYGGQVTDKYFLSILALQKVLLQNDIPFEIMAFGNESLITRGRNACVAYFLSKDYTHLFFIDADVSFDVTSALRIMSGPNEVSCGPYPKKAIEWPKVVDKIKNNTEISVDSLRKTASGFVINYDRRYMTSLENGGYSIQCNNGRIKVLDSGTGFMSIHKSAIVQMKEKYPELQYVNDIPGYNTLHPNMKDNFWLFFDCMKDTDGRYLSEDYAFCRRWQSIGGTIDLDITCQLNHTGSYTYMGNFMESIGLSK